MLQHTLRIRVILVHMKSWLCTCMRLHTSRAECVSGCVWRQVNHHKEIKPVTCCVRIWETENLAHLAHESPYPPRRAIADHPKWWGDVCTQEHTQSVPENWNAHPNLSPGVLCDVLQSLTSAESTWHAVACEPDFLHILTICALDRVHFQTEQGYGTLQLEIHEEKFKLWTFEANI